jgi:hypothetical protein
MRTRLLAAVLVCAALNHFHANGKSAEASRPNRAIAPVAIDKDHDAIRTVVQQYMTFDPAKLREAFYPSANLYVAGEQGDLRTIPFTQFLENVSKSAAAGRALPKMQVDLIDHEGSAAIAKVTERSDEATVTDYLSLIRGSAGWKVVSKTFFVDRHPRAKDSSGTSSSASAENPCASSEVSAFGYMAGEWITSESPVPSAGAVKGASRTEKILDGCAIWEHRSVEQNGKELFDAHVVLAYDAATKRMLLFYVDDRSHTQLYEGRKQNGVLAFYRERPDPDGAMVLIRVTYAQQGKGFTQTVERSKDKGTTWEAGGVTSYEPKH